MWPARLRVMQTKRTMAIILPLGLVAAAWPRASAAAAPTAAEAKVSRDAATATALAKVPGGSVKDAELEKEHGRLVWSFDITTPSSGNVTEVQVDANDGKIVSVATETPAQQRKEAEADMKKGSH